jgi:flagellar hook-length control protein FliK
LQLPYKFFCNEFISMPNMPLFSLQVVPAHSTTGNGLAQSAPGSLQKNAGSQALSSDTELDNSEYGALGSSSFSQALSEELQASLSSGRQEFSALAPTPNASQIDANEKTVNNTSLLMDEEQVLPPLMNSSTSSLPLELQDIQRQRDLSVKLVPNEHMGKLSANQLKAQAQPGHLSMGKGQALDPSIPLPLNAEPTGNVSPSDVLPAIPNLLSAVGQKRLPVNEAIGGEENPLGSLLSTGEDSELKMQSLHEKPITLTPKNPLNSESLAPPVQTPAPSMTGEQVVSQNSDGLWQAGAVANKALDAEQGIVKGPINTVSAQAQFKLDVPPQSPQWGEQIAKRISLMSTQDVQTARIQLDPPEMGALEIKIKIQNDHISVAFASGNQQVRDALEAQSPRLREMLEQQGINLDDVNVSDQSNQQAGGEGEGERALPDEETMMMNEQEQSEATVVEVQSDSLVDYFA